MNENRTSFSKKTQWKTEYSQAITSLPDLFNQLNLPVTTEIVPDFPVKVSLEFLKKIEKNNPSDPLLRQIIFSKNETIEEQGFCNDPVGDFSATLSPGVIQKYQKRVLVTLTGNCALNCRFCFRRNYKDNFNNTGEVKSFLSDINFEFEEVVFSGGDPLLLSNKIIRDLLQILSSRKNPPFVRFHTRLPICLTSRFDNELLDVLSSYKSSVTLVTHTNHQNEIDEKSSSCFKKLRNSGVTLLSQSVLLKNINDSPETLRSLFTRLYKAGVVPYYVHMLDKVNGASHFEVTEKNAIKIMNKLWRTSPGYLVPKLVREVQGEPGKTYIDFTSEN